MAENNSVIINPDELNIDTYPQYCKMYLIQQINDYIQPNMSLTYFDVYKLINSIDDILFLNLRNTSGVLLLSNKVYQLFMCVNMELNREFLFNVVYHVAQYCKVEYVEEDQTGKPAPRYEYEWKEK